MTGARQCADGDGCAIPRAQDVASRNLVTCSARTSVGEAAALMAAARCGSILVVEDGRVDGIWTERDAVRLDFAAPGAFDQPIGTVMTRNVKTVPPDTPISEVGVRFKTEQFRHLVVADAEGRPIGILSQTDVVLNHGVEHYLTFRDVRSAMTQRPLLIDERCSVSETARRFAGQRAEAAIIVGEQPPGIVTERDLVRAVAARQGATPIGLLASRPLVTVAPGATLLSARNLFVQRAIRHLAVREADGTFLGVLSFSDILTILHHEYASQLNAALRERDEALIRSRKDLLLARQVIEASLQGVMIVGEDGLIDYVNPAFTALTGYEPEEALGRHPRLLRSSRHGDEFYDRLREALENTGSWQGEMWTHRKDGSEIALWLSISGIADGDGRIGKHAALFTDITQRKQHEEKVLQMAYFDPLTKLPNRRLMEDRLHQAIAAARRHQEPLATMFLDLDLFKRINDSLGHDAGDAVLVEVARRLQGCVRELDTVARLGGDEFVVLLPEIGSPADAAQLAGRMIEAVRAPLTVKGRRMNLTTSVGVALFPADGSTPDELLRSADGAMYAAKQAGRNSYRLASAGTLDRGSRQQAVEQDLARAIADGALDIAWQIKVDTSTGRVCGAEALARWQHPELGPVGPNEFIPVAERQGLMPALGEWVLRAACAQNRHWQDRGLPPIRVAVNVSRQQFRAGDFAAIVERALADTGLPARCLELELTEEALNADAEAMAVFLDRVRGAGVLVAIDDFGTHHSSITALRRLPVDMLKIDRSLVAGLRMAFQEKELVAAIVGVAHALGLRAVAEGVETAEQEALLRRIGVDEIQGYLIGRTVSAGDLETMFEQHLLPAS